MTETVRLADGHLYLDDQPAIVLCASLFPFRVAPEQWQQRLDAVKGLGYHAIDVYFPWNFHETGEGDFSFEGWRDVDRFLSMAEATGLLVVARPGPYICSEFDGGALPARLSLVDGLRLRQNEPSYLAEVERWFDHILPIIARHQVGRGGSVMLVQLENELDFFPCDDPSGYMTALRDMALRHGIAVPLIACAGQGDLSRATGDAVGVVPAVNLYPSDESPDIEKMTAHYAEVVGRHGYPLMVTETNRLHRTLKRELVAGAALLGPYLQVSGWNFDYLASTGNWGRPMGFMAPDYDFGGVIAPNGRERPDAHEARVLSRFIDSLGPRLAGAQPTARAHAGIDVGQKPDIESASLELLGGGQLIGMTNLTGTEARCAVDTDAGSLLVTIPPESTRLIVRDLPLVDVEATLLLSDAEIVDLEAGRIVLFASDASTTALHVAGGTLLCRRGDLVCEKGTAGHFVLRGQTGEAQFVDSEGRQLVVEHIGDKLSLRDRYFAEVTTKGVEADGGLGADVVDIAATEPLDHPVVGGRAEVVAIPPSIEAIGHGTTCAVYRGALPPGRYTGVVVTAAGDVIRATVGEWTSAVVPNPGIDLYLPFDLAQEDDHAARVEIRAEAWGHSNFHDELLPSLKLGSLRGIAGAFGVTDVVSLEAGWSIIGTGIGTTPSPFGTWASWSSSARPRRVGYVRTVALPGSADAAAVRVRSGANCEISVNGTAVGRTTPLQPVLAIPADALASGSFELRVDVTQSFNESSGDIELLVGRAINSWTVASTGLADILASAASAVVTATELPLSVPGGSARWVRLDLQRYRPALAPHADIVIRPDAENLRLMFVSGDHLIARLCTPQLQGMPFTGGRGDLALIPHQWADRDPIIHILAETIDSTSPGFVHGLRLSHQIDPLD